MLTSKQRLTIVETIKTCFPNRQGGLSDEIINQLDAVTKRGVNLGTGLKNCLQESDDL